MADIPNFSALSKMSATTQQQKIIASHIKNLQLLRAELVREGNEPMTTYTSIAFSPLTIRSRARTLSQRSSKKAESTESEGEEVASPEEQEEAKTVGKIVETADDFSKKNREFESFELLDLRSKIKKEDSPKQILEKVLRTYKDPALADQALDFLAQVSDPTISKNILDAKTLLRSSPDEERYIVGGRNIQEIPLEFSTKENISSPSDLRKLYYEITGNPRTPVELFHELSSNFPFEKMKAVLLFMLSSLGRDLNSKGPSISRAELVRLVDEVRSMQAILGVYLFFNSRMSLISNAFKYAGLNLPPQLDFKNLSRQFMKLLQERYPSSEKVLRLAPFLGVADDLEAESIVFTQFRDAFRETSYRLFRSAQHRQDLLMSILELLQDLDDKLEALAEELAEQEKREEQEKQQKKKTQKEIAEEMEKKDED